MARTRIVQALAFTSALVLGPAATGVPVAVAAVTVPGVTTPGATAPSGTSPGGTTPGTTPGTPAPSVVTQTIVIVNGLNVPTTLGPTGVTGAAGPVTLPGGVLPGGVPATGVQLTPPTPTNGLTTVPGLTITDRNTVRNGFTVPTSMPQPLVVGTDVTPGVPRIDLPTPLPVQLPATTSIAPSFGLPATPLTDSGAVTVTSTTFVTPNGVAIDTPSSGLGSLQLPSLAPVVVPSTR